MSEERLRKQQEFAGQLFNTIKGADESLTLVELFGTIELVRLEIFTDSLKAAREEDAKIADARAVAASMLKDS